MLLNLIDLTRSVFPGMLAELCRYAHWKPSVTDAAYKCDLPTPVNQLFRIIIIFTDKWLDLSTRINVVSSPSANHNSFHTYSQNPP